MERKKTVGKCTQHNLFSDFEAANNFYRKIVERYKKYHSSINLGLFRWNSMHSKASLDVVNQTEVFACSFNADDIWWQKGMAMFNDKVIMSSPLRDRMIFATYRVSTSADANLWIDQYWSSTGCRSFRGFLERIPLLIHPQLTRDLLMHLVGLAVDPSVLQMDRLIPVPLEIMKKLIKNRKSLKQNLRHNLEMILSGWMWKTKQRCLQWSRR